MTANALPSTSEEPDELTRFRAEWKAELKRRKAEVTYGKRRSTDASSSDDVAVERHIEHSSATEQPLLVEAGTVQPSTSSQKQFRDHLSLTQTVKNALKAYRRAIQHEQGGELDDALLSYRQAFRLEPEIDSIYRREEMRLTAEAQQTRTVSVDNTIPKDHVDDLSTNLQNVVTLKPLITGAVVVTGTLAKILDTFPGDLSFQPEDEKQPLLLNTLPDELLILVLRKLNPTSIERFARVCRKARVITLDSAIWRELVATTYKPPQVPDSQAMLSVVYTYLSDFRRIYIEHPRVRMDGVYIALCHYVRPGLSDNSWVNLTHFITYHRYLRFFPDGLVLSLLTNEEQGPQQIIPILKPSLRMKGLFLGSWRLSEGKVKLSNLMDASGRYPLPALHNHLALREPSNMTSGENSLKYAFAMSLELRSRPLGRWNRLEMQSYDSVNLGTGEATPIKLKHERAFWFSKVRSYGSA